MEVALEPPALFVARLDDPRAGRLDLGELVADLDAQPRDLDRERGRGEDVAEQIRLLQQPRVVKQHSRAGSLALDLEARPAVVGQHGHEAHPTPSA